MKLRNLLLVCAAVIATLSACREAVDYYDPITADEYRQAQYASVFKKVFGEIDPNHNWGFGTGNSQNETKAVLANADFKASNASWTFRNGKFTRSFTRASDVAAQAAAVGAYTPTYASAPSVPEDAIDLSLVNPYNGGLVLEAGKSYYIDSNYDPNIDRGTIQGDGTCYIYVKEGVSGLTLPQRATGATVFVLPGAEVSALNSYLGLYNWGTLNLPNGLSQPTHWDSSIPPYGANVSDDVLINYGTLNTNGTILINGTFYSSGGVDAVITGVGKAYIDGDFVAQGDFGLSGELYVGGEMSGNININNGLAAHVGSISTTGLVNVATGSQLMVERDITAQEISVDASEIAVKGATNVSGHVEVDGPGYFEILNCGTFGSTGGDVRIGCSLNITSTQLPSGKTDFLYLTSGAKITLAAGAYLHAQSANFAANTYLDMMSSAFFEVEGKLQLNNVGDNEFYGSGTETAIVKANTIGANYEDFSATFTGNIGVDFEDWARDTSTGLIDEFKNLPTVEEVLGNAAHTIIPPTACNPSGYTPSVDTADYTVYYKIKDTNTEIADRVTGSGAVGATIDVTAEGTIVYDGNTYVAEKTSDQIVLAEGENEYTFWYVLVPPTPQDVTYTVYYKDRATGDELKASVEGTAPVGTIISLTADQTLYDANENEYEAETTSGSLTLVEDGPNEYTFWYNKKPEPEPEMEVIACYRVFAEDLGDPESDFDFNDIVFDVIHYGDGSNGEVKETEIILQAAGGTIKSELYFAGRSFNVHQTLGGFPDDQMINTNVPPYTYTGIETAPPVSLSAGAHFAGKIDPADVEIWITKGDAYAYEILASQGKAAGKICVKCDTPEDLPMWSPEYINIKKTYPNFQQYIGNQEVIWWK